MLASLSTAANITNSSTAAQVTTVAQNLFTLLNSSSSSLTADAASSAVGFITQLAGVNITHSSAALLVGSLSSVVAGIGGPADSTGVSGLDAPPALLQAVADAATAVAGSLLASLPPYNASAPSAPLTVSTPLIQLALSVGPPPAGGISAPGSASAFEPLPASALPPLPAGGAMSTTFMSLAFNPYSNSSGAALSTSGVTRLELGVHGGGALAVGNLSNPIVFTMPGVNATNGTQPVCSFWNTEAQEVDTAGCAGVPSPYPSGHTLAFVNATWPPRVNGTAFFAANDSMLAWSWDIRGPNSSLHAGPDLTANCSQAVLDCGATPDRKLYLNPYNPFDPPALSCSNGSTKVLRVFYGAHCALWNPNNTAGCYWNATKQASFCAHCLRRPTQIFRFWSSWFRALRFCAQREHQPLLANCLLFPGVYGLDYGLD